MRASDKWIYHVSIYVRVRTCAHFPHMPRMCMWLLCTRKQHWLNGSNWSRPRVRRSSEVASDDASEGCLRRCCPPSPPPSLPLLCIYLQTYWAPSLVKQNFNRTQKYKVIAVNKKKTFFKDVTRGDPWVPSYVKQNFNRTKFMKSFTAWGRNIRYGWSNEDAKRIYVCTYILSPNYFFNYIKCQNKIHKYI